MLIFFYAPYLLVLIDLLVKYSYNIIFNLARYFPARM